jgi:flagellar biosynthesis protein FliQ
MEATERPTAPVEPGDMAALAILYGFYGLEVAMLMGLVLLLALAAAAEQMGPARDFFVPLLVAEALVSAIWGGWVARVIYPPMNPHSERYNPDGFCKWYKFLHLFLLPGSCLALVWIIISG